MRRELIGPTDKLEDALAKADAVAHLLAFQSNDVHDPAAIHHAAMIITGLIREARTAFEELAAVVE